MIWPFRNDVALAFGFGHLHRKLRFDGLGRPFVEGLGGEICLLGTGGKTDRGRAWIPLSKRAAAYWTERPSETPAGPKTLNGRPIRSPLRASPECGPIQTLDDPETPSRNL